jgi:septum formation protein
MEERPVTTIVLASQSPARLQTLRKAGIDPQVIVSGVDESQLDGLAPRELALGLARLKAEAVAPQAPGAVVIGCDSVLDFEGEPLGKPIDAADAIARWQRMRGRSGVLVTGHAVVRGDELVTAAAETTVHFADLSDEEIAAYVATGEPLHVAGAFTVDSLGGPFVTAIEGDYHNVVGISLPLLRDLLAQLGIRWTDLWAG